MPLVSDTVAIPVDKGVDLQTPARLVEPGTLLEATNSRLTGGGSEKRNGHRAHRMRTGSYTPNIPQFNFDRPDLTPYGAKILDSEWLFGWGPIVSANRDIDATPCGVSPYPEAGLVLGGTVRDDEVLSWTGHSLISYAPSQDSRGNHGSIKPGVMPVLRSEPIAKAMGAQNHSDGADNGRVRMVAWDNGTSLYYAAYDHETGSPLILPQLIRGGTNFAKPRIFSLGNYLHIVAFTLATNSLSLFSMSDEDLANPSVRVLGECGGPFDVWKVDETRAVIARLDQNPDLHTNWVGINGSKPNDETEVVLATGETAIDCTICTHPTSTHIGVAIFTSGASSTPNKVLGGTFTRSGALVGSMQDLGSIAVAYRGMDNRLTIAPKYLLSTGSLPLFDVYYSLTDNHHDIKTVRARYTSSGTLTSTSKFHLEVASHAFRAGDRTFAWMSYRPQVSTLQSLWVMVDEALNPVGHMEFSTADVPPVSEVVLGVHLKSVNFHMGAALKDQLVFHHTLNYRVRVPASSENTGLFSESSIKFVELDFLPQFQAVQAGRAVYFPGAQVWSYDGAELTEAGFHTAPEVSLGSVGGGSLTTTGTYSYRVDFYYKNGQGEEIRSHSLLAGPLTLAGAGTINVTVYSALTCRTASSILIYRNAMISGVPTTTWNLINSRDPSSASYLTNTQTTQSFVYVDTGAVGDAAGLNRELHPASSVTYLHPFASPACEILAGGRDRLWASGGEIPVGQVSPSRLFTPYETPAFNTNLNQQVDRNEQAITAMGFVGELMVIFRDKYTYVLEGDGPDNQANGFWPPARLALADTGAINHLTLALVSQGLIFQSQTGFRLIGPGGQLVPIGIPVDRRVQDHEVVGTVVSVPDQEVRFYGEDETIVYNYKTGNWSIWTCGAMGATRNSAGKAVLFRPDGYLWVEEDDFYRDGDSVYTHRVRFPWLHAGNLGDFQRVRRLLLLGEWDPEEAHKVRLDLYYDERDFPEETLTWNVPDDSQDSATWGDMTWGDGLWGDTTSVLGLRDSVWRFIRVPSRQKCSVFSPAISDAGTDGRGFQLNAICLELGKKMGLDRTSAGSATSNTR